MASASSHSHQQSSYEYLDALLAVVPHDASVPKEIEMASPSRGGAYPKFVDTALRLASGGPPRPDDAPHLRDAWPEVQASVQRALHALHSHPLSSSSPSRQQQKQQHTNKRKRSPPPPPSSSSKPLATTTTKKPKYEGGEGDTGAADAPDEEGHQEEEEEEEEEDAAQLTLHALSATAPVRHKVDITLHARTLRLAHSTTGAAKASCARTALTRVYLLPTRARSSGAMQWTALLLAGDKPSPPPAPRGASSARARARAGSGAGAGAVGAAPRFELACAVPDSSSVVPRITTHASASASTASSSFPHAGTAAAAAATTTATNARDTLLAFLSSILSGITTTPTLTLTTVERGTPLAGITAFRGVRETSLWFFDGDGAGILADARPAEFWAVADLAPGDAGVRVRTATGRTCSVVLTRRRRPLLLPRGNETDDEDDEGEETEFQMIDGKERERILEWVRSYRGSFGITKEQAALQDEAQEEAAAAADGQGQGQGQGQGRGRDGDSGAGRGRGGVGGGRGDSDDSDSDFEVESGDSDGGSPSNSNGSDGSGGSGSDADEHHESRSEDEDDEDEDEDEDDEDEDGMVELDPKHHPLLRADALLPKMSRAAMDDAVQLVVGDLLVGGGGGGGPGRQAARRSAPSGPGPGPPAAAHDQDEHEEHEDEGDDEEDELDD
ncbi:hypothetical protein BJV74DRAFT_799359 [Russula compacta]|nr:hypothetical protein BJV74DRAFT_799359 [Russula compacta]